MKFDKMIRIMLGVGFLMGFSGGAFAEDLAMTPKTGRIHFGHLSIIPGLGLSEEYDDNIFLKNGDNGTTQRKESDWLTHLRPSLVAKYDMMERGAVSLGYLGDFAFYNTNSNNNWSAQTVSLKGDYKAPAGLILGINNDYVYANDPYTSTNNYQLGQKIQRWTDGLQTKVGYEFADIYRIVGFYNFNVVQYDLSRDSSQNYNDNEVGAGAEMRVMPMTWAFLRYYTGARDYTDHSGTNFNDSNDADYKWNRVNTGLTWDATAKISGEVNVGYQWLTANNQVDPNGNPYEDKNSWTASTRVNYQATPKTSVGAELYRATLFSGGNTSEFYDETGFGLNLKQQIMTKGMLRTGAWYARDDYNQPAADNQKIDNYKAFIGFDYYIKEWLMAGVEYRYWDRDSNVRANDFTDNRIMMTVAVAY